MTMKKFINQPERFIDEMLYGLYAAHPSYYTCVNEDAHCLITKHKIAGKVGIATGGGSGHLPLFLGYVGKGMLDGCSVGDVFQSPSSEQMLDVTKAIDSGAGVLYIFGNYNGDPLIFRYYHEQMRTNPFRDKQLVLEYVDRESLQLMLQTTLFEVVEEKLRFHPRLLKGISDILQEYSDEKVPLVSITLTALYTSIIVAHEDMRIDYKNTSYSMIDYKYKNIIHGIIPRKGIPHDRDETKALQVFYKDTLFHEFDHSCPICGINIPHMLIASHIKPFRDCAHIYEAIDHDNGLLLCRNHDYLFDQGYFTFDENGYIIFSEELLEKDNLDSAYSLRKNYRLAECYLSENRMKFMAYHREFIFHRNR